LGVRQLVLGSLLTTALFSILEAREPYTEAQVKEVEAWLPDKPGVRGRCHRRRREVPHHVRSGLVGGHLPDLLQD
jgi:hypothetical protein